MDDPFKNAPRYPEDYPGYREPSPYLGTNFAVPGLTRKARRKLDAETRRFQKQASRALALKAVVR